MFENRSNSRYTNFDSAKPVAERQKDLHAKISKKEVGNEMAAAREPKTARGPARKQRAANATMVEKMMPHNWMCAAPDGATDRTRKTHRPSKVFRTITNRRLREPKDESLQCQRLLLVSTL
ncbi:hypothetical protein Bca4012_005448 [Brassica carinata]|uniref:Uncharacterized protein n=1 Tax=Brassica carinata TaxID=52824 RepID=A0A8X7RQI5_BRACI|nr:hypothetical protein Bca52824_040197 [Brassica carinata]